ncbi:mechanosensitive ion channel family protein [Lysobacter alkalisoli]|uniref:Mechanosensitive ion channel family protein n=2 Tax=Marilutibacter alkalisoli TaxID=2591633 RepID=A0A514BW54_9GAMM|nr:mechanosensitive ion channel family protein [Lysobacter alkalisoli]
MLDPVLDPLVEAGSSGDWTHTLMFVGILLGIALVVDLLTQRILRPLVVRAVKATPTQIDDLILARGVLKRLAHVVPALVIYYGIALVPNIHSALVVWVGKAAQVYIVLNIAMAISAFLSALNDLYERRPRAHSRPIKGYVQLVKIVVYTVALVIIVSVLISRSPLTMLAGLGAMGAVLMLVFKDTILSLVASVQIASNDMVRVGDWIEMPSQGVDGDVVDVALHTVKVQNFDKTIVTVPTHRLIEDSVKNWRGMSESGGRRIKRALHLDQAAVRFLDDDQYRRLQRFVLLERHFKRKREELGEWNAEMTERHADPVNTRRLTNLGCFRAYVTAYLESHPKIDHGKTLMVRQLAPGPTGLPLEIYCFAATTEWGAYEGIQADIFDHLLAILPEFGLRLFQQPGGADLMAGLSALRGDVPAGQPET